LSEGIQQPKAGGTGCSEGNKGWGDVPGLEPDSNDEDKPAPCRYPQHERGAPERFGLAGMADAENITWDNPTPKEALTCADSPLWWHAVNS
jgi:hypothetical protein